MDSFIEYMIQQKKSAAVTLKKCLIYFAALAASLIVSVVMLMFPSILIGFIPMAVVLIFFIAYRLTTSFDIEFEYILTNGELDIDKITHKRRRKRLLTIHSKSFTCFAKVGDEQHKAEENAEFAKIIDASARSKTYDNYYAVFFKNGQKIKLIFNPTQKMIDIFKIYAPRVVK